MTAPVPATKKENEMAETKELTEDDADEIAALLVGRRVVSADEGSFEVPDSWRDKASGRLTLDDGTVILVSPNYGGCSCGAGDYDLTHLASVDNIITSARVAMVEAEPEDEWSESGDTKYQIFVFADNTEINLLTIEGSDGNGYYGTGYTLTVEIPS